jgi:hypothetical protein
MNSAIDQALAIGASFDWITPTLSICGHLFNGEAVLAVPISDWAWAKTTLRSAGVRTIHHKRIGDKMLFNVPGNQAERAKRLLGAG